MVCPDLKVIRESRSATSLYNEHSYELVKREEFAECHAFLCPCYSEYEKKQYCSKYRPEPKEN